MATNGWIKSIPIIQSILVFSAIALLRSTLINMATSKVRIAISKMRKNNSGIPVRRKPEFVDICSV